MVLCNHEMRRDGTIPNTIEKRTSHLAPQITRHDGISIAAGRLNSEPVIWLQAR